MTSVQPTALSIDDLVSRIEDAAEGRHRLLLGVAGAPGAGKSTLAEALVARLGDRAIYVPMDGFHLSNQVLETLGRRGRKGAPDTFDAAGYVHLLRRLKQQADDVVYAPTFRRALEEPIAASIAIPQHMPIVITEGNYLLVEQEPWGPVNTLLDSRWFLLPDDATRRRRLISRHVTFGMTPTEANKWVVSSDEPNAQLVLESAHRADLVFSWSETP